MHSLVLTERDIRQIVHDIYDIQYTTTPKVNSRAYIHMSKETKNLTSYRHQKGSRHILNHHHHHPDAVAEAEADFALDP